MIKSARWVAHFALQRLVSQWRSLLTIIAGVLLSAAVGALVPLYTAAVAQVGMVERFNQLPPTDVQARANINLVPSQTPDLPTAVKSYDEQFRAIATQHLEQPFPGWINRIVSYGETSALDVDPDESNPTTRVFVAYYEGWQDSVTLVAGRVPVDTPASGAADIEIVVPFEAQQPLGLSLGDTLILDQGGPSGGWPTSKIVRATIVGIAAPPQQMTAVQAAYFMAPSPLRVQSSSNYTAEYPVLTTQDAFNRVATEFVPDTPMTLGWRVSFDHTRLPFPRSAQARASLFAFQNALRGVFSRRLNADLQFNYSTKLINWQVRGGENVDTGVLLAYEQSVRALDAPFGLLLLQVGALVIFFLVVTAALVRRGERREIGMLQSRGATDQQIIVIRAIEALIVCVAAALAAPFVAQQLLIAITPFFANYPGLPLELFPAVFAYSAAAASVAFVALLTTLPGVLRLPLITAGGATLRSDRKPWWQRAYLDVILVVVGLLALWRLAGRDTPLFTTVAGGRATDPFLLLAPALLFLGLGSVLLRLFPLIATLAARTLAVGRGLIAALAAWQVSREPVHYGRIALLLSLAIGTGWFATSFRATVTRSQSDQARYEVGTDLRFSERDLRLNTGRARPETAYTAVPGVAAASVVWRQPAVNFQPAAGSPISGQVLAVNPATFNQVYYWRDDLGMVHLPEESQALPDRGSPLPFVPQKLHLWAEFTVRGPFAQRVPDLNRLERQIAISARLLDATETWIRVPFKIIELEYSSTGSQAPGFGGGGDFKSNGWAYLEADLTTLAYQPVGPVRLVSLYWQHRSSSPTGERFLELTLAGLTGVDSATPGQDVLLNMLTQTDWQFDVDTGTASQGSVSIGTSRHGPSITAHWDQSAAVVTLGALLNYPTVGPIPLVASTGLAGELALVSGQQLTVQGLRQRTVDFTVISIQHYFPTLYDAILNEGRWTSQDRNRPFAIVNRDLLLYALNRRPSAALYADEVWIKAMPGVDSSQLLATLQPQDSTITLTDVQTLTVQLATLQIDPLSLGLLGLMFLAFLIALVLSMVGLLTYAALTAAARRSEFGVLRALGLSTGRLVRQMAYEQIFVIGLGVILGGALGAVLSSQIVPRLAQDTSSQNITPPFVVQVETAALLQYAALILVILAVVLIFTLVLIRQLSLSRSLRLGEE